MENDRRLVLPVQGKQLAEFILSLLGQRRTYTREFQVRNLVVSHDHLINILEMLNQRIAQNASEMLTLKSVFYFSNGRSVTVFDRKSFNSFDDLSQEITVGVDIQLTYLVRFPGSEIPARQDIRLEIFSNTQPRDFPGKAHGSGAPQLKYVIDATDLTWGEDIANHLNKVCSQLELDDSLSRAAEWALLIPALIIMLVFISSAGYLFWHGVSSTGISINVVPEQSNEPVNLGVINTKLDILIKSLVKSYAGTEPIGAFLSTIKPYPTLVSVGLASYVLWLIRRYGRLRFVACNRYTKKVLENRLKTRDHVKWAVIAALAVGLVAGVVATRLDSFFFSHSPI